MKNTLNNPYLFDPDNTYLKITAELSYADPSDQPLEQAHVSPQAASKFFMRRDFSPSIPIEPYFQSQYHVIAIFVVCTLLIFGLLLSSGAFLLLLK